MKIGDKVNVVMTDFFFSSRIQRETEKSNGLVIMNCTIKYMPSCGGDTYVFITEDGIEFVVNSSCSAFVGIEKVAEESQDPNDIYHRKAV